MHLAQEPEARRELKALPVEADRAVGPALLALHLDAEGGTQFVAARTRACHAGPGEIPLERCRAELAVHGAVIFLGHPGLSGHVQLLEGEVRLAFEHGDQAPLDARPEVLLL